MQHEEITEKIIGCAYHVYNKMGFGFLESVYFAITLDIYMDVGDKTGSENFQGRLLSR